MTYRDACFWPSPAPEEPMLPESADDIAERDDHAAFMAAVAERVAERTQQLETALGELCDAADDNMRRHRLATTRLATAVARGRAVMGARDESADPCSVWGPGR